MAEHEAEILNRLGRIEKKVDKLMTEVSQTQTDINNAVTVFGGILTDLQAQTSTLVTDVQNIAALIADGQPVTTAALNSLVAGAQAIDTAVDSAVESVTALAPPPTPPAS